MTGAEERELLADYLATCSRLADGFDQISVSFESLLPIDAAKLDSLSVSDENIVLAYLKRFEQFEDVLGRTIKTIAQMMALGKIERLTPRDVANRAESFGIVDDAERWAEAVRTRNALAREYPLKPEKRAQQVNAAWDARATLLAVWRGIMTFTREEGLVDA